MQEWDNLHTEIANLDTEHRELLSCLSATENSLEMLKSKNEFAFEKVDNKFKDRSRSAVLIRRRANDLKKEFENFNCNIKDNCKLKKNKKDLLTSTLENIDKEKGPFKAHFDQVLDSFKLERTVYHSGALIRNDVNNLTKLENIKKLCNVFKPREIVLSGGSKKTLVAMNYHSF